ncbi:MAG: hypothetical protein QOH79_2303 [Acidimicrobiaceae bacterium]
MTTGVATKGRKATIDELVANRHYDYADAFETAISGADKRSPEQLVRAALENPPWWAKPVMRFAHRVVARFQPIDDRRHVQGWTIVAADADVAHIVAKSPMLQAEIVLRKLEPTRLRVTTALFYDQPVVAGGSWTVIGPFHRAIAPRLLDHVVRTAGDGDVRSGSGAEASRTPPRRARQIDVPSGVLVDGQPDYADAFEVDLGSAYHGSAEQFLRSAFDDAPRFLYWPIYLAHRGLLQFDLGPRDSNDHVLGWALTHREPDAVHVEADGPIIRGKIVAQLHDDGHRAVFATSIFFKKSALAAPIFRVVAPGHRALATHLLDRFAAQQCNTSWD